MVFPLVFFFSEKYLKPLYVDEQFYKHFSINNLKNQETNEEYFKLIRNYRQHRHCFRSRERYSRPHWLNEAKENCNQHRQ